MTDKKYIELRKTVRAFLREIEWVPFREVDCDQDKVDTLIVKLTKMTERKNKRSGQAA